MQRTEHVRVAIVGSGFGGLGAAIRLKQQGENDFLVFERADGVGGVWRDNRYPGCACDVQSHLYSLSFAPNPRWSRRFSPQPEIWEYLRRCAADFGIEPHLKLRHEVTEAVWMEGDAVWRIHTPHGAWTADVLIAAPGALSEPRVPDMPGLNGFAGRVVHSARWPDDLRIDGARVAVIGTGASAIQIIPAIQPRVQRLTVFQRTPPWVMPRHDRALSDRVGRALTAAPPLRRALRSAIYGFRESFGVLFRHPRLARIAEREALRHLRSQVADPRLRALLTPDYRMGCKRVLLSDDYYPALTQSNVELVPGGAAEVRPGGVVGADDVERAADVIVFGTGFHVTDFPFASRIRGRAGARLSDVWGVSPRAHLGTTVAGFPNLFVLQGPNTGLGHTSVVLMIEAQIEHILNAMRYMQSRGVAAIEPTDDAQAAFVREVDEAMESTVWIQGGCHSWYLDPTGRNSTLWPGSVPAFRRRVQPFHAAEYRLHPRPITTGDDARG